MSDSNLMNNYFNIIKEDYQEELQNRIIKKLEEITKENKMYLITENTLDIRPFPFIRNKENYGKA